MNSFWNKKNIDEENFVRVTGLEPAIKCPTPKVGDLAN